VFAERASASTDWRVLEPAALALILSGRTDDARPLINRLQSFGFVPWDPGIREQLGLPLP